MIKPKQGIAGAALVFTLVVALWITGVIPKMIGKQAAMGYVNETHGEIGLTYQGIEFSTQYGAYIVSFLDEAGNPCNFRLSSKYFLASVAYDGILQSNVT